MLTFTFAMLLIREVSFILSGMALCHMAYKLFVAGVQAGGAEEMSLGTYIKLKGGGPGLVFVTLGAAIILYTIATAGRLGPEELQILMDAEAPAPVKPAAP